MLTRLLVMETIYHVLYTLNLVNAVSLISEVLVMWLGVGPPNSQSKISG